MRSNVLLLRDMIEAANDIDEFMAGLTQYQFLGSKLVQAAVLQKLITIGEAASRLSDDLRGRYPYIPWRQIRAFRNIAIHNYAGVDYVVVWHAAKSDTPTLRAQVQQVLSIEETP